MQYSIEFKQYIIDNYKYEPETGYIISKLSQKPVGYKTEKGYIRCSIKNKEIFAHQLAIFIQTGEFTKQTINHKNCKRDDNRWRNLELTNRSSNSLNCIRKNKKTGYRGITQKNNMWSARCTLNKKRYFIGNFKTMEEAAKAYDDFLVYNNPDINRDLVLNFPQNYNHKIINKNNLTYTDETYHNPPTSILLLYLKNNYKYDINLNKILNIQTNKIVHSNTQNINYYKCISINFWHNNIKYSKSILYHKLVWFLCHNEWFEKLDDKVIDHIDRNYTNNNINNLRLISKHQNCLNRPKQKNNNSGYIGVCFNKLRQQWCSSFSLYEKNFFLGYYNDKNSAAEAYDDFRYYFSLNIITTEHLNFPNRIPQHPEKTHQKTFNKILKYLDKI